MAGNIGFEVCRVLGIRPSEVRILTMVIEAPGDAMTVTVERPPLAAASLAPVLADHVDSITIVGPA